MYKYTPRTFCGFACVVFILLVTLSFTGCDDSKIITGTTKIDSLEWKAIAEIQEWKSCNESGWEVPEGAIVYKEQEEIKSYKTVGYETKYRDEEYECLVKRRIITMSKQKKGKKARRIIWLIFILCRSCHHWMV